MKRIKPTNCRTDVESRARFSTANSERAMALKAHTKRIQAEMARPGFDKGKIFIIPGSFSQLGEVYGSY